MDDLHKHFTDRTLRKNFKDTEIPIVEIAESKTGGILEAIRHNLNHPPPTPLHSREGSKRGPLKR